MLDIITISAFMNISWYIFTIIFMLYKFTSFFTKIYQFYKVVKNVKQGFVWLKNKFIKNKNDISSYPPINSETFEYNIANSQENVTVDIVSDKKQIFSEFVNSGKTKEKKNGLFLPFFIKDYSNFFSEKELEEISLVESNYLDANSNA